ncbi:MAG: glycoside hydrolase family 2 protein, partial [Opitutae bacterium]|nr:glycoside hydrolase family 2 protein [Opitutae bacterium]
MRPHLPFRLAVFVCLLLPLAVRSAEPVRERESFNSGWRFARFGPMPDGTKLAEPAGLESPATDDAGWRQLDLPHDWGLPWPGIGWYRKQFTVSASDRARRVFLDIDGAMSHAKVWLNGHYVGEWPYGYSSFRLELTPHLKFGGENVLAIRLDNPSESSRWYPGGGIFRNVWLVRTAPVHVAHWGVFVTTPEIAPERAAVEVRTKVDNQSAAAVAVTVRHEIHPAADAKRIVAAAEQSGLAVAAGTSADSLVRLAVPTPALWDITSPNLHVLRTTVRQDGRIVDTTETTFGIRTTTFDPAKGFSLNGRQVRLQGVCLHSDLGPLGTAVNTRYFERQLELLRELGCNAIRTAHNAPAPELLELCDRMGFLVMDEAFDAWGTMARDYVPNDYSNDFPRWHERDIQALVRRDRNHPSIVMWSSGNEIADQKQPGGGRVAEMLRDLIHSDDPTRPVTGNLDFPYAVRNGFARGFDLIGHSYKPHLYAESHDLEPTRPVLGSETASTLSSRGEYFFPVTTGSAMPFRNASTAKSPAEGKRDPAWRNPATFFTPETKLGDGADVFQISSYDLYYPPWANNADLEFASQDLHPFVLGEFVWTGFDYLGEPTPYDEARFKGYIHDDEERRRIAAAAAKLGFMPARSSYFGIFDLAGFRKDRFYLYQARWRPDLPMAHILPHWNWPERIGQVTPVHVYTSGDEAELFLNGRTLGRKKRGPFEYRLRWDDVKYAPGELKVIAYKAGREADGQDLTFITVSIRDQAGLVVPRAADRVRFSLTGPGDIVAVDNGDATRMETFKAKDCAAFNGLCLVIIRARAGESGAITLRAEADGLKPAETSVQSRAALSAAPAVAALGLTLVRTMATKPFAGGTAGVADSESLAYCPQDDTFWIGDDDGNAVHQFARIDGHFITKVTDDNLEAAFPGTGRIFTHELETVACDPANGDLFVVNTVNDPKLSPPKDKQAIYRIRKDGAAIAYESWHPLPPGLQNKLDALVVIEGKLYAGGMMDLAEYDFSQRKYPHTDARGIPAPVFTSQHGYIVGLSYEAPYLWILTEGKQKEAKIVQVDWRTKTEITVTDLGTVSGVKLG